MLVLLTLAVFGSTLAAPSRRHSYGLILPTPEELRLIKENNPSPHAYLLKREELPVEFDSRQVWGSCIHPVLDQGQCGSCWAFSATESLSDRLCIESMNSTSGKIDVVLSPQYLVSCDEISLGCNGGLPDAAWAFMKHRGVPTLACVPYQSGGGSSPTCKDILAAGCASGSGPAKLYYARNYYDVSGLSPLGRVERIMEEIMTRGPVQAGFIVWSDFDAYTGGVYSHKHGSGTPEGAHAVKIIGWGVSKENEDYWLVQNSWGTNWGIEGGFFKIKRGSDECGIETMVFAGLALV